jgi:nitronate monooxygenase
MAVLPRHNASSVDIFELWLRRIRADLIRHEAESSNPPAGPVAVDLSMCTDADIIADHLEICSQFGIDTIFSSADNTTDLVRQVHDWGGSVVQSVTSLHLAHQAISAGVDGLRVIGTGNCGTYGAVSHLAVIPKIRAMFDGLLIVSGGIANGADIRAAEVLGADLACMGTRFACTQESMAPIAYENSLVDGSSDSIRKCAASGPDGLVLQAGHGIDLVDNVPSVANLIERLRREYIETCQTPSAPSSQIVKLDEP